MSNLFTNVSIALTMSQGTPEKRESREISIPALLGIARPSLDLRAKVLSLVVLSALLPSLIVGVASYVGARQFLTDKVKTELATGRNGVAATMQSWFDDRSRDARTYANAEVVLSNLDLWLTAPEDSVRDEAARRIESYMSSVLDRSAVDREFVLSDRDGRLVARAGSDVLRPAQPAEGDWLSSDAGILVATPALGPHFYLRQRLSAPSITDQSAEGAEHARLGDWISVSGFDDLWTLFELASRGGSWRLRTFEPDGRILFDSNSAQAVRQPSSEGIRLSLSDSIGVASYRNELGRPVLGAYETTTAPPLGILLEVDRHEALAAVDRLRDKILIITLLAAGVVAGAGYALVISLSRPIEALTVGAEAVARGKLKTQVPVTSKDEIGYLTQVFNQMTKTLRENHAKLERMSSTDELTGLHNRRHLTSVFKLEISRAERSGEQLAVLMVDIDHFKQFNDRFGHLQGDALLKDVGQLLLQQLRPTDTLVRYGGEEFTLLLPATTKPQAGEIADRVRACFSDATSERGTDWALTISVGVAVFPDDGLTQQQLLRAADAALYEAKRRGRNCVVLGSGDGWTTARTHGGSRL